MKVFLSEYGKEGAIMHSTNLKDYRRGFFSERRFVKFIPKIDLTNLRLMHDASGYITLLAEIVECCKVLTGKGWKLSLSETIKLPEEKLRNFIMAGQLGLLPKGERLDRADLFTEDYPEGDIHIPTFYFHQFCCGDSHFPWFKVGVNDYR
jgi:hypothetical protein